MKNLGKMTGEMGFTQKSSLKKCNHSTTKEEIKKATPLPGPGHYYKFELLLPVALT